MDAGWHTAARVTQASVMASDHDAPAPGAAPAAHGATAIDHGPHGDDDPHADDEHADDDTRIPNPGWVLLSLLVGFVIGLAIVAVLGFGSDVASLA